MVDKRSCCNTTLAHKGINYIGQLFDTNEMKPWSVSKGEFSLSKSSNFYWIQLSNEIRKAETENLYKGDRNFNDFTFSRHHITKKYQTYSLIRCNRKESLSMTLKLKVSLNDTKTKSQIYFEKFFKIKRSNGNLYTL